MTALLHLTIFALVFPLHAESFSSWSAKAQKAQKRGDSPAALEAWSKAISLWKSGDGASKKAAALAWRADLFAKSGQSANAIADLTKALSLTKTNAALFHRRGRLYMNEGRLSEAISDFYSAARIDLRLAAVYVDRAAAYERQGDRQFAQEDLRTACRLGLRTACGGASALEPKSKPPLDIDACLATINACTEQLNSLSVCVSRAPICHTNGPAGCCPRRCVQDFAKTATPERSDAEVFRRVFSVKGSCRSHR